MPQAAAAHMRFRFGVVREPTINAFAWPHGAVYVHAGLLARLENEAQLAHILGHEVTHTVQRHQLKFIRSFQNKTVAAKLAHLVLAPAATAFAGGLGNSAVSSVLGLTYAASVTGFGRASEEEADLEGLRLAAAAGYHVQEAPRVFALLNEVKEPGATETFFYADHPTYSTRSRYTQELIDSGRVSAPDPGVVNADAYATATRRAVDETIRLRLQKRHYQYALLDAAAALRRRPDDPLLHYYTAEAHRQIAADPDGAAKEQAMRDRKQEPDAKLLASIRERRASEQQAALTSYERARELGPTLALVHRGLGLLARDRGEHATARRELEAYLASGEKIVDRRYIEKVLTEVPQ